MMKIAIPALILFSGVSWADNAQSFFKAEGDLYCINYASKLQLVTKISRKQYEVSYQDPATGEKNGIMILFTNGSEFSSKGLVTDDLWVKANMDRPEKMKVANKEFEVIRESTDCAAKSAEMQKHPSQAQIDEEKSQDEENAQTAEALKQEFADMRAAQARDEKHMKLSKAEQKKADAQVAKDRYDKMAKWAAMTDEQKEAKCKEKGIVMDTEQTYCM